MKQKAGLWLCRGTERSTHHNTEPQTRAAISTHNSPSPLKSVSSGQSYIPSVHFHPGSQYSNSQTNWNTIPFCSRQAPRGQQAWVLPYFCACRRLWRGLDISEQMQTMPNPPGPCGGSELAPLLLSLCRQPLSQGCQTHTHFYSKQV